MVILINSPHLYADVVLAMRCLLLIASLPLFCAQFAQALSIFPEINDTRVAVTTNREIARGIASDRTNFLVVFQGDNLYPAPDPTNQLAAQLIAQSGSLIGPRIDLAINGGVPLVESGTSNYLMTWTESANGAQNIRGQFLDRVGNPSGSNFLIASNTSAVEVGAITFAAGTFWITWAQTNVTNGARIMLQRVSESGGNLGGALALGSSGSDDQEFPVLSAGGSNLLMTWVARRSGTNQWDVLGRLIDPDGTASLEFSVSETPALAPYPVAAACDGKNHLVVWSCEAGSSRILDFGWRPETWPNPGIRIATTNQFPMLFGRLIDRTAPVTNEFSISTARWGQVSPSVSFDGTNYLIAWNDRRFAGFRDAYYDYWEPPNNRMSWAVPTATNQTLFFCFLDRRGDLVDWEFIGQTLPPVAHTYPEAFEEQHGHAIPAQDFDNGARINTGPVIRTARDVGAVLRNRRSEDGQTNDVTVTMLTGPRPGFAQIKLVGIISNYPFSVRHAEPFVRVQILSTNSHFIPQWSSNAVDWVTPKPELPFYDLATTDFIEAEDDWLNWTNFNLRFNPAPRFFRAVEDKYICKSNLRKVARRKELWALRVELHYATDVPMDPDLYNSALDKPACPSSGWRYSNGEVNRLPVCPVPFHEFH